MAHSSGADYYYIGYIKIKKTMFNFYFGGTTSGCSWMVNLERKPELIPDLLTEWCSLCGNDRYYWPALKGSGISSQPGTNWSGKSVGTVWVAGIPEISETRSN